MTRNTNNPDPHYHTVRDLWHQWDPMGYAGSAQDSYEALTTMTLATLKNRPSEAEMVHSIRFFLDMESKKQRAFEDEQIREFVARILGHSRLMAAFQYK